MRCTNHWIVVMPNIRPTATNIYQPCNNLKMGGVYATAGIAKMVNLKTTGNLHSMQQHGSDMSAAIPSLVMKSAVTSTIPIAYP